MPDSHALRRERLRTAVAASEADAALITSLVNVRYLTGLASSNAALLLPADGPPVLVTDSRYLLAAERDCPDLTLLNARNVGPALADVARERGVRRLGFEAQEMTVARHAALAQPGDLELIPLGEMVEELRVTKDEEELALLARACAITGAAFDQVVSTIRAGMTERELATAIERAMVDSGAEKPAFDTIVASGPNGAIPHHAPGARRFEAGDMITIDCGARYGGYHADMTRTVVLGPPADWQRDIYALVAGAQQAGIGAAVPGAARDMIKAAGHGEHFGHGLGHGVGLEIHEAPQLGVAKPGTLGDRVPVTVEPGVYLPGIGGVRIEDTLVVRSGAGPAVPREVLTTTKTVTPGELLVLEP